MAPADDMDKMTARLQPLVRAASARSRHTATATPPTTQTRSPAAPPGL